MTESLNRVEISLAALKHNYLLLKSKAPHSGVIAMVKADGYGHGMLACAKTLVKAGTDYFGVAEAVEGVDLRKNGISQPILIMAGLLKEVIPSLFDYDLTPAVVDGTFLAALSAEAGKRNQSLTLHLKVDAGMGRQGCLLRDMAGIIEQINALPGLELGGILAHFPRADEPESDSTPTIVATFCREVEKVRSMLPDDIILHLANSGGVLYFPVSHKKMIRPGISLYGYYPDGTQGRKNAAEPCLQPVMRYSSRVTQVKEVPKGTGLGYGHSFITKRPSRIAIIPVGYEDGYSRALSNRGCGLIHGQRVPVVGRVSMNLTMFDVTDLEEEVVAGDEVVLLGRQGREEISADEIGDLLGTISYEVVCLIGNLNHRVYLAGTVSQDFAQNVSGKQDES